MEGVQGVNGTGAADQCDWSPVPHKQSPFSYSCLFLGGHLFLCPCHCTVFFIKL